MTSLRRARKLLATMTLPEKLGQLRQLDGAAPEHDDLVRAGRVGSVLNHAGVETMAYQEYANRLQRVAIEENGLGIPLLLGRDVIHGYRTILPIPSPRPPPSPPNSCAAALASPPAKPPPTVFARPSHPWSTSPAIRAGAASRKVRAKTRTTSPPAWARPWSWVSKAPTWRPRTVLRPAPNTSSVTAPRKAAATTTPPPSRKANSATSTCARSKPASAPASPPSCRPLMTSTACRLPRKRVRLGQTLTARATVTNRGRDAATEVVQLYVRDVAASLTRPVKELMGFERITLAPGASRTVSFTLHTDDLAFHGADGRLRCEPGEFRLWIAPDSSFDPNAGCRFDVIP